MLEREHVSGELTGCDLKAEAKKKKRLDQLADMIAKNAPVFDHQPPRKNCSQCRGEGRLPLPSRSGQAYIPKMASCLTLIEEILARKEQVVVFSAFNDPLDSLSRWLTEADVHHVKLDGRVSQKKRGAHAAKFKRGRHAPPNSELRTPNSEDFGIPVMLAGVECMAEGHSFHLANNVILIAYSWAYDKFIQAINRVHRMNSEKPVNIYVIVCQGTIDVRLESLIHDKNDSAELVLDGRLIGEKSEEINLAELLKIAHKEFDPESKTIDEAIIQAQWPALREKLRLTAQAWQPEEIKAESRKQEIENVPTSTLTNPPTTQTPIMKPRNITPKVTTPQPATHEVKPPALTQSTRTEILAAKAGGATAKLAPAPHPALPTPQSNDWRARLKARVAAIQANTSGKP